MGLAHCDVCGNDVAGNMKGEPYKHKANGVLCAGAYRSGTLPPSTEQAPAGQTTTHELKCWPEFFKAMASLDKLFEIRKNDRDFKIGDILYLREWDPSQAVYTGAALTRRVTYLTDFPSAMKDGYICMGLTTETDELRAQLSTTREIARELAAACEEQQISLKDLFDRHERRSYSRECSASEDLDLLLATGNEALAKARAAGFLDAPAGGSAEGGKV